MDAETRHLLQDRARHLYGLATILKCDIDILRKDASDCNLGKLRESIHDTDKTLQKLMLVVGELEYILNLADLTRS